MHLRMLIQVWMQGADVWVRGHSDLQAVYDGLMWHRILCYKCSSGPLGPPRVLRTARATSGGYLAAVRCAVCSDSTYIPHKAHLSGCLLSWTPHMRSALGVELR